MKKVFLSFMLTAWSGIFFSLNAQEYKTPEKVVVITKQNVNVRQAPQASSKVVGKASNGAIYEFVAQEGTWYKVKDVKSGNTVFISTTVGRISAGNQIARTDKGLVEPNDNLRFVYQKREDMADGERITSYGFYQKQEKNVVYAMVSQTTNTMTGRSFTNEVYYKGKQMGWYLFFDEVVDMDGVVQTKLDTPTVVFSNGTQGVIIDGQTYKKTSYEF